MKNLGPLEGVRVLELGQLIAGPFAGSYLAYFGAEVVKIESPDKGDPLRNWRGMRGDTSWWWYSLARNKKSVAIDLRDKRGQEVIRSMIGEFDVLIENFRPGVMESWGLGPETLRDLNPDLIYSRVSGYGQTGPNREKPGFASVCEGFSGFRYLNGFPDEVPVRPNLSMGDSIAGMFAVTGILMALLNRPRKGGETIDVALYESMFSLLEAVIPEYSGSGEIRGPSGTTVTGIVPTNTYACADGKYLIIGGNGDSIFVRLMQAVGRDDLANDPELSSNPGRVRREVEIDQVLKDWCSSRTIAECLAILEGARVPAGPVYDAEDISSDEHYRQRQMLDYHQLGEDQIAIPAYAPKLQDSPGGTHSTGPRLGAHTREVLTALAGITEDQLQTMHNEGVIKIGS